MGERVAWFVDAQPQSDIYIYLHIMLLSLFILKLMNHSTFIVFLQMRDGLVYMFMAVGVSWVHS